MSIIVAIKCDDPECKLAQKADFERFGETFGDLLDGFRGQGWRVFTDGPRVVRSFCPTHAQAAERIERDAGS